MVIPLAKSGGDAPLSGFIGVVRAKGNVSETPIGSKPSLWDGSACSYVEKTSGVVLCALCKKFEKSSAEVWRVGARLVEGGN